jgi:hypothetical protein
MSCAFWRRPVLREGAFEFIVARTSQNNGFSLYSTQSQRSSGNQRLDQVQFMNGNRTT